MRTTESTREHQLRQLATQAKTLRARDLDRHGIARSYLRQLVEQGVLVQTGRGLYSLAEMLGASICTTRDVTDAGWLPRQYQVGLTGRAISPKLYVAIAIRGAFEHMVGVRRAGTIVVIDPTA